MYLQKLSLSNYRNYESLTLDCDPQTNIFIGANGQGKTNLLEAVYYLCVARSFREAPDKELVRMNSDFFVAQGNGYSADETNVELLIRYATQTGKKVFVNELPQKNLSDIYGLMTAVVISPDDRRLVQGGPSTRRRFIDIAISQSNVPYLSTLQEYRRVVRQRNEALRTQQADIDLWNTPLIDLGCRIIRKRVEVVAVLKKEAQRIHANISDKGENLEISYSPSFNFEANESIESSFRDALIRANSRERVKGMTEVGPHRDDISIEMNGVSLQSFGSQGQHKTAATALKLAEAHFLCHQGQAPPLLLLDDIFAEIDIARTWRLMEMIPEYGQTFITTAKEGDLGGFCQDVTRFRVSDGVVAPYS